MHSIDPLRVVCTACNSQSAPVYEPTRGMFIMKNVKLMRQWALIGERKAKNPNMGDTSSLGRIKRNVSAIL